MMYIYIYIYMYINWSIGFKYIYIYTRTHTPTYARTHARIYVPYLKPIDKLRIDKFAALTFQEVFTTLKYRNDFLLLFK
jgi:hypothetical protein